MQLLTEKIKKQLPKLYATENIPFKDKEIVCKFFNPCGARSWYVVEGTQEEDDFILWGLVDLHEQEWGYFSLSELESLKLPFGLTIERDLYFQSKKAAEVWKRV